MMEKHHGIHRKDPQRKFGVAGGWLPLGASDGAPSPREPAQGGWWEGGTPAARLRDKWRNHR